MQYTVQAADKFISKAKASVDSTFRPEYHFSPSVGWINDPNGLIYYGGEYHLFYQYHPYDTKNGAMHWGHCVSEDLLTFKELGVALAPDQVDEDGCFSGGAEIANGGLTLVYTRHRERTESAEQKQTVCIAETKDGENFTKRAEPVFDNGTLPSDIDRVDFRDPYPVKIGDKYYVFVGGKKDGRGAIIVLSGRSLDRLEYGFAIGPFDELGNMAECPSYCRMGDKDVIIVSGVHEMERSHDFKTVWSCYFIVGNIDFERGNMRVDVIREIDRGDAFYAPQFVRYANKPVMIAWFENWGKRYVTRDLRHGWVGAFTVPRELVISDGDIVQKPIAALECKRKLIDPAGGVPHSCDITARAEKGYSLEIVSDDGRISIGNDDGRIYLDTRFSNNQNGRIRHTEREYGECDIRILIDVSGVELFVDGGRETISSRIYMQGDFKLKASGVKDICVYQIQMGEQNEK